MNATNLRLGGLALIVGTAIVSIQCAVVSPLMGLSGAFLAVLLVFVLAAVERSSALALGATVGTLVLAGVGIFEGVAAAHLTALQVAGLGASALVSWRTRSVWPQGLMSVGVSVAVLAQFGAQSYAPLVVAIQLAAVWTSSLIVEAFLRTDGLAYEARGLSLASLIASSCVAVAVFGPTQVILLSIGAAAVAAALFRWVAGARNRLLSFELAAAGLALCWAALLAWGAAGFVLSLGVAALLVGYQHRQDQAPASKSLFAGLVLTQAVVWGGIQVAHWGVGQGASAVEAAALAAQMLLLGVISRDAISGHWLSEAAKYLGGGYLIYAVTLLLPAQGLSLTVLWLAAAAGLAVFAPRQLGLRILAMTVASAAVIRFCAVDWQHVPLGWGLACAGATGGLLLLLAEFLRGRESVADV